MEHRYGPSLTKYFYELWQEFNITAWIGTEQPNPQSSLTIQRPRGLKEIPAVQPDTDLLALEIEWDTE